MDWEVLFENKESCAYRINFADLNIQINKNAYGLRGIIVNFKIDDVSFRLPSEYFPYDIIKDTFHMERIKTKVFNIGMNFLTAQYRFFDDPNVLKEYEQIYNTMEKNTCGRLILKYYDLNKDFRFMTLENIEPFELCRHVESNDVEKDLYKYWFYFDYARRFIDDLL